MVKAARPRRNRDATAGSASGSEARSILLTSAPSLFSPTVRMQSPSEPDLSFLPDDLENPAYLRDQIITYLGNKRALLPFLGQAVRTVKQRLGKDRLNCVDLFSGSGIVARFLKREAAFLAANDLELYSEITNRCYLSNKNEIDQDELRHWQEHILAGIAADPSPGLITRLYAPRNDDRIEPGERVFYSRRNALFLDAARRQIARLPKPRQALFLAPLLAEASVRANTAGVFKGFYKNRQGIGQFGGQGRHALTRILGAITLPLPVLSNFSSQVLVTRRDANDFFPCSELPDLDLCYLDPPYNQHPYGSNYFMLNLLAEYQEPTAISPVSGIPENWNRSRYNQSKLAEPTLLELIHRCPAKFILISYNSEGFIHPRSFSADLARLGRLEVLETTYNAFRGCRNLHNRNLHVQEFLFLLEKS